MKRITAIVILIIMVLSAELCVNAEDKSQDSKYKYVMIVLTEKASKQVADRELTIDLCYFRKYDLDIIEVSMTDIETQMEAKKTISFSVVLGKDDFGYSKKAIRILKQDENFMIVEHGWERVLDNTKADNPMKLNIKTKIIKYKKIHKAKQTVAPITVKKAQGKVIYKKLSGSKKLTLKADGRIVVKKGTKKGAYFAKIKNTAKGNKNYNSKSITKKVTIKIK